MSGYLKALQQPEHVHVLLNHLPLTGLFVALVALIAGAVWKSRACMLLGLALVSLTSLSAWPVSEYGERGFDRVLAMADSDGQAYLQRHRELADRWIFLYYVTAGAGGVALLTGWKWSKVLRPAAVAVSVLAVASLVAGGVIAECGGKVRHREFRFGPVPQVRDASGAEPAAGAG